MYERELVLAKQAAIKAGKALKEKTCMGIKNSMDKDLKTVADQMSEKIIVDILRATDYSILSEEAGIIEGNQDYRWIIDPLDGTVNYIKGMDELACVSIALYQNIQPVFGVVYRFMSDELIYGVVGQGAFKNEERILPSSEKRVAQAVMATGFPVKRDYSTKSLSSFIQQVQKFKKVRMLGTAAIMSSFVADGRIDAYFEDEIMLWDVAAAKAIVDAAGGITNLVLLNDNKCNYKAFANKELWNDFCSLGLNGVG